MNIEEVIDRLRKKYPGKNIVINNPEHPTEIVCEVKPDKKKSIAIAVIDRSVTHYHRSSTETYEVLKGKLTVIKGGDKSELNEGESITILPGERHRFRGNETWLRVTSTPGWTPEDNILVE